MSVTETSPAVADAIAADATLLMHLRRERATSRARVRAIVDRMIVSAQARLGAVLETDPVSGYPACLVVVSSDKLDAAYEAQTPRPRPDTFTTVRIELLGRVLTLEFDDFGRARISGVPNAAQYTHVDDGPLGPVFVAGAGDEPREHPPARIDFDALLGQLVRAVLNDEQTERDLGRPPDFTQAKPPKQEPAAAGGAAAG